MTIQGSAVIYSCLLAETTECLIHGLKQAFMKRGLPRALMTDNGAAMLAEETRRGLQRLGIEHETTLPYSPYQNGKQEAFWGQLESRLLELLRGDKDLKLAFVNQAAQAWVEQDYHRRIHSEIKTTPLMRMLNGPDVARPVPDSRFLQLAFTRRIRRTPRRSDATVVVDGVRYELPVRFAHLPSVILRAPGWDKSQMTLGRPEYRRSSGTPAASGQGQKRLGHAPYHQFRKNQLSNQTTIPCQPCCGSGLPIMPLPDCLRLICQRRNSAMNNTDIRSLYGLKYNPFLPDVPPESLFKIPGSEQFFQRVQTMASQGGFALITGDPGLGKKQNTAKHRPST